MLCDQQFLYEGAKDKEALRRKEWPDGKQQFYEGAQDGESLKRVELPYGHQRFCLCCCYREDSWQRMLRSLLQSAFGGTCLAISI